MDKVVILFSTYNNEQTVVDCLRSCMNQHDYQSLHIVVADDGSSDHTVQTIQQLSEESIVPITVLALPHGERGVARVTAIEEAQRLNAKYIFVIDSDMILANQLVSQCTSFLNEHPEVGALVVPEEAYSTATNFFSKVKVFERNVINNAGEQLGKRSIEAARFWRIDAYESTGGFNADQIAFEEIQPTLRYVEEGGEIRRATFTRIYHDEKQVYLNDVLRKKAYYFSVMDRTLSTEEGGLRKALERWYFFRPVLYSRDNLICYLRHPLLTVGMVWMYICLSVLGVTALLQSSSRSAQSLPINENK
ncbi:glycosyltransferase family A protein [Paenibacillus sp. PsM32]|uniref:glycosyltransferase family A protein n=1 Tax=unclassified Paenibacillus TaxID=185978 RepID=UPI00263A4744|nr:MULTISPECIES: glycosyltransferase family A protein [unclassified Paenibacillus]MDN4618960.1 glycosyltransferase family A protein [Paenibacillus sp. PsM32]MDQ1235124.1 glycosyltransferase involved in cell wall biosynthesis [Paenibacillus sp. SORGH_AS_0306]MDR6112171.1 glycosyltransferase involved in cell wall biosynthesis [Paenibacillus sp. SORGH_AS_0338]